MFNETGNYEQAKTLFSQFNFEHTIYRGPVENVTNSNLALLEVEVELKEVADALTEYFGDQNFRGTIPFQLRQDGIEAVIINSLPAINQIPSDRVNNQVTYLANKGTYIQQIRSFAAQMNSQLMSAYRAFVLNGSDERLQELLNASTLAKDQLAQAQTYIQSVQGEIDQKVTQAREQLQAIEQDKNTATGLLQEAEAATGGIKDSSRGLAINSLSRFFYQLVIGKYAQRLEEIAELEAESSGRAISLPSIFKHVRQFINNHSKALMVLLTVPLLELLVYGTLHLFSVDISQKTEIIILIVLVIAAIIAPMYVLVLEYYRRHLQGYQGRARIWLIIAIFVSTFTFLFSAYVFKDFIYSDPKHTTTPKPELVFVKSIVLLPLFYLSRFSLVIYRSNKHLAVVNTHRSTALQTSQAYINGMNGSLEAKDDVSKILANLVFDPGETGFITRSQGAGDTDGNPITSILGKS